MPIVILRPPGPTGRHFLSSPLLSRSGPLVNLPRMAKRYGDVVFWRFLHISTYFFAHPDDIESVLVTKYRSFTKGIGTRANPELFGQGLLTSEGDYWLRQRRLSQPAFHRTRIAAYADTMAREADRMLNTWRDGQQFDLHREMMQTTLAIATRTLFGVDLGPKMPVVAAAMDAFVRQNAGLSVWRLVFKLPTPSRMRFLRGVRQLDEIVYRIIRERRASGVGDDLLSDLLRAQDEDGSSMTDQQLRDEVMTMLLAGHETTALALSWAWYLLATHPEEQQKLHDELDRVLVGRLPCANDAPQLAFTNRVVREALRIYPPAWVVSRRAAEDVEIGGYTVPTGSNVIVSPWVTHRDAQFFPDPLAFKPDRWLTQNEQALPKFAYFPFGGGPRVCIGSNFALMEAVVLLAAVAQRYQITLLPGANVEPMASITLRPANGVWVRLHKR
ncbi:MAG TPA: cytochrome P450 [Candidatus Angelobacter sp.]|jgi:cytochrome P450|nr:cytochrome P450 [Candidatus Angelobacter sp.]